MVEQEGCILHGKNTLEHFNAFAIDSDISDNTVTFHQKLGFDFFLTIFILDTSLQ